MLTLMLITKRPAVAKHAFACGVQRIFVDMEILGKHERQGHLNTVISDHTLDDVASIRTAVPDAELMVRLNPLHFGTQREVDGAIAAGADLLMLPMFESAETVQKFSDIVAGRAGIIPLVETKGAAKEIAAVAKVSGLHEVFIGLNDLHMSLGRQFMFELLADGTVERLTHSIKAAGRPFGFGGIARIGEGTLPAHLILGEHVRLGSRSVILSRAFHKNAERIDHNDDFRDAVAKVRAAESAAHQRSRDETIRESRTLGFHVDQILRQKAREAA
jgi:hypothetical protein